MHTTDPARADWLRAWSSLRVWRLWSIAVALAFLPALVILPSFAPGLPTFTGVVIIAGLFARSMWLWKCPRCRQPFGGWLGDPWPDQCAHCGVEAFAATPRLRDAFEVRPILGGRALEPGIRRGLAILEILTGLTITALVIWAIAKGLPFGGWLGYTFESFAALSIIAGIMLWRDTLLGFELSEIIQWMQLLRIQVPAFSFVLAAGPEVLLVWSANGPGYYFGLHASLTIGRPSIEAAYIAINFVAMLMLVLVRKRRLAVKARERECVQPHSSPHPHLFHSV